MQALKHTLNDKFAQRALHTTIKRLANYPPLRYTERQLYYEWCRALVLFPIPPVQVGPGLLGGGLVLAGAARWSQSQLLGGVALGALMACGGALLQTRPHTRPVRPAYDRFQELLEQYRARHVEIAELLPAAPAPLATYQPPEPDLLDYGLDRVILCQSPDITHMLLANRFYLELKCAIFDWQTTLPAPIYAMLERTDDARILLLHDASPTGIQMAARLQCSLVRPANASIVDIGLRPVHAQRLHLLAHRHTEPTQPSDQLVELPTYLKAAERHWLRQGWAAELAAIPPIALLRKLRRIVARTARPAGFQLASLDPRRDRDIGFMTWPEAA